MNERQLRIALEERGYSSDQIEDAVDALAEELSERDREDRLTDQPPTPKEPA